MSVSLLVNGQTYNYPQTGDTDWGNQATGWAQAVTAGLLPKLGGTFLITGDINFGSIAGIQVKYLFSNNNASVAATGFIRMANGDKLTWLSTNTVDTVSIGVDSDNLLKLYADSSGYRIASTELAQSFTKSQAVTPITVSSSSGTLAIDASASNNFQVTLTENISTITLSNMTGGEHIFIAFKQGVGSYTVAWPASFTFVGTATASPAVSSTNTKLSVLTGVYYSALATWIVSLANQP